MEDIAIVLMMKNKETGFLEKEIGAYRLTENENLLLNMFAVEDNEGINVHVNVSTDRDVEDWEFSAIYDYYDAQVLIDSGFLVGEVSECYNPTWEVVFPFNDDAADMEKLLKKILTVHRSELEDVYEAIKDLKQEYSEE